MERISHHSADGSTANVAQIDGLNIADVKYPRQLKQVRHTHRFASFSFVLAGDYLEKFSRKTIQREPSTIIFHPPEESHAVDFESNVRILSVGFDFARLAKIQEHSNVLDEAASLQTGNIDYLGRKLCREFEAPDVFSALAIEGLILEILAEAARGKNLEDEKQMPRWLAAARDYLHDNFTDSLSIETAARVAGVHPVHLARVFRRRFGCTVGEYVRRLRVDFANRQILSSNAPLSEIALAAGFADQSHLNKTFKAVFGRTPAEQRKIARLR